MSSLLPPSAFLSLLRCPCPGRGELSFAGNSVRCGHCGKEYSVTNGVLDLAPVQDLDARAIRERETSFSPVPEKQFEMAAKLEKNLLWKDYYTRNRRKTIQYLSGYLTSVNNDRVFFLGAGTGREIGYLESFMKLDTVLCSDLSPAALSMIPVRLAEYDCKIGLFTSDITRCPIATRDMPVVFVNVLHHTPDMHEVLETYLGNHYKNIMLIEPTNNVLIRFLAKVGLARRLEYSGITPGRLEILKLRRLCKKHGYSLSIKTRWSFPQDYYQKVFRGAEWFLGFFFLLIDSLSLVTGVVKFGNISIAHLKKIET
jgi:hypothetical protein